MVQYVIYEYDGTLFRDGVRNGVFVLDKAITPTGFAGVEDTDWVNIETHDVQE